MEVYCRVHNSNKDAGTANSANISACMIWTLQCSHNIYTLTDYVDHK